MADSVQLDSLSRQLAEAVELVPWCDEPPAEYGDVRGIFTYGHPLVDGRMMDRLPQLRTISNFGVGIDHIDVAAARERGITVSNTPGVLDGAVADLAMTLLLAAARNLAAMTRYYAQWFAGPPQVQLGSDLEHQTLGIVGLGRIGGRVARRAQAFGMRTIYHNRRRSAEAGTELEYMTLDQLLSESDFVMLTLPLTEETRGLIGRAELQRMKPTAQLINVARGAIVDTAALMEALSAGWIAGAALDVTEPEPLPERHPLREMPNVFLTPHLGSATRQTREAMGAMSLRNLMAGLAQQ
ncbi:MAG: D-glycerate dehydrogenase [Pirellulales bacterium]